MFLFIPISFPFFSSWYIIGIEITSTVGLVLMSLSILGTTLSDIWRWIDDLPSRQIVGPYEKIIEYYGIDHFDFNLGIIITGAILTSVGAIAWPFVLVAMMLVGLCFGIRFTRRTYKRIDTLNKETEND